VCLAETDKRKVQKRHACLQTRNIVLGRYPTGSGARTVVACEPPTRAAEWETARAASPREPPPSPPRGAPPVHAPTRFSSRDLKVPLASRKLRVGFPSGICEAPTGKSQPSQWEVADFRVGSRTPEHRGGWCWAAALRVQRLGWSGLTAQAAESMGARLVIDELTGASRRPVVCTLQLPRSRQRLPRGPRTRS